MRSVLVSFALAGILTVNGLDAQSEPVGVRLAYGPDSLNVGELAMPLGNGPFPVAILLHGGCWSARLGSIDGYRGVAARLREEGVASWAVEYRRVGHPGGGWPGTYRDLAAATDHIRELAREFRLDTGRVALVGHSSGGYFAGWIAGRQNLPSDSPLRSPDPLKLAGLVASDAYLDPFVIDSKGVSGAYYCGSPILEALVGGDPRTARGQLEQVSPLELLPYGVPQEYVVSSFRYPPRPGEPLAEGRTTLNVADYPALARSRGDSVVVTILPEASHLDFYRPETEAGAAVVSAILRILRVRSR